jgi:putative Mg2+ transporter-C (MgtC) family protein
MIWNNLDVQAFVLLKVFFATLLGGFIGWEREAMGKPAGLRTHMLVAGASALMAGMADILIDRQILVHGIRFAGDPTRIIQAITVGVAFIGSGVIVHHPTSERVSFLTTAACILFSSAIGISAAFDQFLLAAGCTLLVIGVNRLQRFAPPPRPGAEPPDGSDG